MGDDSEEVTQRRIQLVNTVIAASQRMDVLPADVAAALHRLMYAIEQNQRADRRIPQAIDVSQSIFDGVLHPNNGAQPIREAYCKIIAMIHLQFTDVERVGRVCGAHNVRKIADIIEERIVAQIEEAL